MYASGLTNRVFPRTLYSPVIFKFSQSGNFDISFLFFSYIFINSLSVGLQTIFSVTF